MQEVEERRLKALAIENAKAKQGQRDIIEREKAQQARHKFT